MAIHYLPNAQIPGTSPALSDVGIIIPTYNAARHWHALQAGLDRQGIESAQILIIDSSSSDGTRDLARQAGYRVVRIPKEDFNHGATRQLACSYLPDRPYLVFLTHDVVLAHEQSIQWLLDALANQDVGAAYGRQLPRLDADPIERHGRLFNYPEQSHIRDLSSRETLGFKTVFFSDSFAVYRRSALESVGGFPLDAIVSEEVTVAARMLLSGWKIAYVSQAQVFHSHPLSLTREFSRYFDIGVHHGRERWLLKAFGGAGNEGQRFVRSQLSYLYETSIGRIPYAMLRMLSKYVAYHLGKNEIYLPNRLKQKLSAHPGFWSHHPLRKDRSAESIVSIDKSR